MTIRHRITLLVVLMLLALSAIGGYAVLQTRNSAVDVRQVTQGVVPSALASADLVSEVKDVQLATMTLVYAPDANMVQQSQDQLMSKEASLRAALDVQAKAARGQAQTGLVAQARESLANYFDAINQTAQMKAAGKNELAQAYLSYLYSPEGQEIVARHFYRPRDPQVMARHAKDFPQLTLVSIAELGGWTRVQREHFAEGGIYDQITGQ